MTEEYSSMKFAVIAPQIARGSFVRITKTVVTTIEVLVVGGTCYRCHVRTPPIDTLGAVYILDNHDAERMCFPYEESVRPERDRYPVTGWQRVVIGEHSALVCASCARLLLAALSS